MNKIRMGAVLVLCAVAMGPVQASDTSPAVMSDTSSVAMLAHSCAGCHGTDGSSVGPSIPSIAGMDQERFEAAMLDYRRGGRGSTIMTRIAKGYTDAEISGMAEFFATKDLVVYPQTHDPIKAKLGTDLHMEYCNQCHTGGGTGAERGGYLAGQWMPYLEFTMEDYRDGLRPVRRKMMRKVEALVAEHGEQGLDALVHYYGSFR